MTKLSTIVGLVLLSSTLRAQHHPPRGDAMGFDQAAVAHHFLLKPNGGVIEVQVRDRKDAKTLDAIHTHLRHIAMMFADGNFEAPLVTHGEHPPGVETMQRLKSAIRYSYGDSKGGGRVEIVTKNAEALDAVHQFLRYQIREHHTGDPE